MRRGVKAMTRWYHRSQSHPVMCWFDFSFEISDDSGLVRAMWEPRGLSDGKRWCGGGLKACHSFFNCHKSLPWALKVRLRWLPEDLQAPPARHMSFYQPRPRWHCGSGVLTPPMMRNRKEGKGGKCEGRVECVRCVWMCVGYKRA